MSNDVRDIFKKINELSVEDDNTINLYDSFDIELNENFVIETGVVGFMEDGVIVEADESMLEFLDFNGVLLESEELDEAKGKLYYEPRITSYSVVPDSKKEFVKNFRTEDEAKEYAEKHGGKVTKLDQHNRRMKEGYSSSELDEAEYQGRKVPLGKPMKGDVKKSKVYVKKPNGKVVKVNFGDKNMRIKKSNPNRRKSFRARHNCANPGPRWKARYWSCRAW